MRILRGVWRSRVLRVVWLLEELGQPYELRPDPPHNAALRALHPSGKIPALVCDEGGLTDSAAIMGYLADWHCQFDAPVGSCRGAQQDAMCLQILDEI